jgi:uncharacterized membrane protein required for colicin V production
LKQKIKNSVKIFGICVFIVTSIYIVQTIGYSFEKYVIESDKGLVNQVLTGIFGMVMWGFVIFFIVMISRPFRNFFLKWFNVDSEPEKAEKKKGKQLNTEIEQPEVTEQERLKREFQHRTINP